MNFINSTQAYGRPVTNINIRPQLRSRDAFHLPGGILLWKSAGKIAAVVCMAVICVNMVFASLVNNVDTSINVTKKTQGELQTKYEVLSDYRDDLWSEDNIAEVAAEKLALYAPVPGQIKHL